MESSLIYHSKIVFHIPHKHIFDQISLKFFHVLARKMAKCFGRVVSIDCLCLHNERPQTRFYCCGVVTDDLNDSIARRKRHGMVLDCLKCNTVAEVGKEIDDNATAIFHPTLPFLQKIPEGLYVGRVIEIQGKANHDASRFEVNFLTANSIQQEHDVCFHFNPRFDRRVIVRNSKKSGTWGEEEIAVGRRFPLEAGKTFRLVFYIADGKFLVAINNRPFCSYLFRMPLEIAKYVSIDGDIFVKSVKFEYSLRYPLLYHVRKQYVQLIVPQSPFIRKPVVIRRTKLLCPGTKIELYGRVKLLPQNFYVNLQEGNSLVPHPLIPLHINLRLCQPGHVEQRMVLNSWINGSWGSEIIPSTCPFLPGLEFKMTVIYFNEGFHISVNGQFLSTFPMRCPCPPWLDTVLVEGDVIITKLKVFNTILTTIK